MAKRSPSSDAEDNSAEDDCKPLHKRQRMVVFEPVRLVAVSGVNDIDERVDRFKLAKLGERLKLQQKMIADKDRNIERLTARQDRDDNTLCMVNRHWNRLDEDLAQFRAQLGMEESGRDDNEQSNDFLSQIAQMDDDECEKVYDARVKYTHQLAFNVSEAFTRRSEQFASLTKKLKDVINGTKEKIDLNEEMVDKVANLAEENKILSRQNHKLQTENRDLSLKMKERDDRIALLETKNEEIKTQLDEKEFEVQKSWRREEKLERRLAEMSKEKNVKKEKIESNGSQSNHSHCSASGVSGGGGANANIPKDDDVLKELEMLKELCASREQELNDITDQLAHVTAEKEKLAMDLKNLPDEVIRSTEEFQIIQTYYTFMVDENQRLKDEKDAVVLQMAEMKNHYAEQMKTMEAEEDQSQQRMIASSKKMEERFAQLRKDYEILSVEYRQTVEASEANGPNAFDYRTTVATLNNQMALIRADCLKFKQKWKTAVTGLSSMQRKMESERMRMQKYVLIPLNEEDIKDLADPEEESPSTEDGTANGITKETSALVKLEKEKKLLQASVNTMKVSLAKILKKDDRRQMWSEDSLRRLNDLEKSLSSTKAELAEKTKEEEGLLNEMEATGQAFEELQEQNGKLLNNIKEQEENNLKAMSDRIYMVQSLKKLKDEKEAMDQQIDALMNTVHALKIEMSTVKDTLKMSNERLASLSGSNDKLYGENERLRREKITETKKAAELKIMSDKTNTQLKEAQQALSLKNESHVKDENKIRRLEEDRNILKKKLERFDRSALIGSTDAVLMEEIKELKDVLTCPSCKVRRKDGILTKCFHVFCMDCLKTRYETRRRKCPKCNAAFGANDFHRVYIG
uniref:E3 ubiquitin protein ligase n=1 Tax=Pristionchus pacificus TaxID=54126 RepID=A0A8R1UDG2_PRIPA